MIKLEAKELSVDDKTMTEAIESDYKVADKSIVASTEPKKYCNICDITFNYMNTFMAHKKFYCKAVTTDMENNSSSAITQPAATVLTRTAETSVL